MAFSPTAVVIKKKSGMGCCGCGCSLIVILVLLFLGLVGASAYYLYHLLGDYTATSEVAVPQFDGGAQLLQNAQKKLFAFQQGLGRGQPASLHLNSDEINTLIARDPSFARSKGHLFVTLRGNEATIQTSLPLGQVESYVYADRYLNGDGTFALHFDPDDKTLDLDLHGLHLKNHDLSADLSDSFNKGLRPLLNQELQSNSAARAFLNRAKKITVENSQLVIETQ